MRAAAVVAGVSSAAIFLHGCGSGGGSSAEEPCHNAQFQLVSQSWDSNSVFNVKVSSPSIPGGGQAQDLLLDMTEKIDVDNVNVYAQVDTAFELPDKDGHKTPIQLSEQMIFNAAKKEVVMKVTFSGKEAPPLLSNCSKISIPSLPSPSQLSKMLKVIATSMGSKMKCSSDGTYDSWDVSLTLPDESVSIPQNYVTGTMKETMKLDKDGVLQSATVHTDLHMNVPNGTSWINTTETEDMAMTTSNGKLGGPTDSDLDYSSWGECSEIKPPPHANQYMRELSKSLGPHESFLPHMLSKSMFARAVVQAAEQGMHDSTSELVTV